METEPDAPQESPVANKPAVPAKSGSVTVWVTVFLLCLILLAGLAYLIFPGTDDRRDAADWLLITVVPLVMSATIATFATMFIASSKRAGQADAEAVPAAADPVQTPAVPGKEAATPPAASGSSPFGDWLATEWTADRYQSLGTMLDRYIAKFIRRGKKSPEPVSRLEDCRTKLTILKQTLAADARWKETPELGDYIEDLESLIAAYELPAPPDPEGAKTAG